MSKSKVLPDFYKSWTETGIEPQTFQICVCTSIEQGRCKRHLVSRISSYLSFSNQTQNLRQNGQQILALYSFKLKTMS